MAGDQASLLRLYRAAFLSRAIDAEEDRLVRQGLAHFHVSGAGHESTAMLAEHLRPDDWLHLHYRDKALLLARGMTPLDLFRGLLATASSHSAGRQMSAHFSARHLNIMSMVGPVGNNALQAVGAAEAIGAQPGDAIVVCCVGDGTTQQGEFLEAVAEAVRSSAPVLFVIEDNHFSISTRTARQTFFDLPGGRASQFMGMPIHYVDGVSLAATGQAFEMFVRQVRAQRAPALLVLDLARHSNHTNTDDQRAYRSAEEIAAAQQRDPLVAIRNRLLDAEISEADLSTLEGELRDEVAAALDRAISELGPAPVGSAKAPLPQAFADKQEYLGDPSAPELTMREALNEVLRAHLAADPRLYLCGEDIEDPKGDVFGVTRGLSTEYPGRVQNSALSESTIVGTSIGRAMAGQLPIAFIQFADFLPLAFNQIVSELGSLYWRSNGTWQAPVILMVSCGGYRPGLGPFHAQTLEGVLAHVPGIDVVMPSNAASAAGLLNAAIGSARPTVFLYPKAMLNLSTRRTSRDVTRQFVHPGRAAIERAGTDLSIVTYGNPLIQSLKVADALADSGVSAEVIDLRSISPWDSEAALRSVRKTRRLLVVHEDNREAGFGAEVVATLTERAGVEVKALRVARDNIPVPFHFENQLAVLPSFRSIMEGAARLLEMDVEWEEAAREAETHAIFASGSAPSDDELNVIDVCVAAGQRVEAGQVVAVLEASKSAIEIEATTAGTVATLAVSPGDRVRVGSPLVLLADEGRESLRPLPTEERALTPRLRRRGQPRRVPVATETTRAVPVEIVGIAGQAGARSISNSELALRWPSKTPEDIFRRTGIERRRWIEDGETVLSLATAATRSLLAQQNLRISDIDLLIATTGTPDRVTPALAFRVAHACADGDAVELAAYDVNAACSGYLYALAQAHDHIQRNPSARVVITTAEVLSPLLDPNDFGTAIIFADGATATLVAAKGASDSGLFEFSRPLLSGAPDDGSLLSVPLFGDGFVAMDGQETFTRAVRAMTSILGQACAEDGLAVADLSVIVPHQANKRILEAIERRVGRPVLCTMGELGNTSSSSIPFALMEAGPNIPSGERIGLAAFGGGASFAAAVGVKS